MKKSLLSIIFFFASIFFIRAQTLYGTTSRGGSEGGGTINKFLAATKTLTVVKSFEDIPTSVNLTRASDGKLYGVATGGSSGNGVIFSFDYSTSTYTKLKDFDGISGANPSGSLLQASDGKLYGITGKGGSNDNGVIFSFDPYSSTYTKLKDFDFINGGLPSGNSLMQASDGKLYGMTTNGGSGSGGGVIFSFDISTSTYIKLKEFDITNGGTPVGNLIQASDGKLYGMTLHGGSNNAGVIFSFDPLSSAYMNLKNFDNANGGNPYGSLTQASDGKLYGITFYGGSNKAGVIFSFDPLSFTYKNLKDFDNINGGNPYGSLMQASDGKLYGLANGGSSDYGVLFSLDPVSFTYKKLKDFDKADGRKPSGSLIQTSDGKLYGMTLWGENDDGGVLFSFDPISSSYTKLKDFGTNNGGSNPVGSLMRASNGKLYGTTYSGGSSGVGVIFSFDPCTFLYTKLKDFDGTNGGNPSGSLIQASNGKLYGMTHNGGSSNAGVIFSFDPSTFLYTKLKDFDGTNGGNPYGSLMQASDGKLYGMTYNGGRNGTGVIFSFDQSYSIYTILHNFDYENGSYPTGNLIEAIKGKLYGMTSQGSNNSTVVLFSFDFSTSIYTKCKDFEIINLAAPYATLIKAGDGKLYGMTYDGGYAMFSFDPFSSTYTKLAFHDTDGLFPNSLMQASDGKLYGISDNGGSKNYGVISSFDPSTATYIRLKDFNWANGAQPAGGAAFIEVSIDENKPPSVKMTSPAGDTSYVGPALIQLMAGAKDSNGIITKVELYNGETLLRTEYFAPYSWNWKNVLPGNYTITAKAYDNDGGFTISAPVHISVLPNKPPVVKIIHPVNDQAIAGPSSIIIEAEAGDADGNITKVALFSGETLLRTEYHAPYSWKWNNVAPGNYIITAKAYDNNGGVTTSAPVQISVMPNKPPSISLIHPINGQVINAPASILFEAAADDPDGKVVKVSFYNGESLFHNEYYPPFSFTWQFTQPGNYTITAKATDNLGKVTTSVPASITVTSANKSTTGSQSYVDNTTHISNELSVKLMPVPVKNILTITTDGFQQDKKVMISLVSVSGAVVKKIYTFPYQIMQMDVTTLRPGVYFLKIASGEKKLNARFVKL